MKCDHKKYNPDCAICKDVLDQCGYAFKHGSTDYCDPATDWEGMVEYYNTPAPEPDEAPDDDEEHYDMEKAQEEADAMDAESHLLQVDEPEL